MEGLAVIGLLSIRGRFLVLGMVCLGVYGGVGWTDNDQQTNKEKVRTAAGSIQPMRRLRPTKYDCDRSRPLDKLADHLVASKPRILGCTA